MKKIIFTGVMGIALLFAGKAQAQSFYVDVNGGYGLGMNESVIGQEVFYDIDNPQNSSVKNIYGTLGKGANITVTPGYMFNDYLGVEIGLNYFLGSESRVYYDSEESVTLASSKSSEITAKSNQFRIIPSLVFNTGGDALYGYAKAGLVLPVSGKTASQRTDIVSVAGIDNTTTIDTESKGNLSLGFRGSVGLGYKVLDFMDINLEVFYTGLHIKSKTQTITSYTAPDGSNPLSGAPTYSVETEFVDELNSSSNNDGFNPNVDLNKPKEDLASKTNFSQFGVQIGLKFRF